MKRSVIAAMLFVIAHPAAAQEDCIENIVGRTVCGADADAVRARIRAEQALKDGKTEEYKASASGSSFKSGSVYKNYGNQAFVRGGYVFAGRGGSAFEDGFGGSIGVRHPFAHSGRSAYSIEGELLYARNSEDGIPFGTPVDASIWTLTGLVSLRWDYETGAGINPFLSVGGGPSYVRYKIESGLVSGSDDDFTFAYSGRAGFQIELTDQLSLEPAYRYLGTTQPGTPGAHSGEIGVNLSF